MTTITLLLFVATLLALLNWLIPTPQQCWLPPNAPTRGMYAGCWTVEEIIL